MQFLRLGLAGMRGEVGNGLTPTLAIDYASAVGTFLDGGKIVVGHDSRISSDMLVHATISALLSCGCQVLDAGICPAPMLHFLVPHLQADGGLLIGGGHHPAGWNALVPLNAQGAYFNEVQIQELLDIYHSHRYRCQTWNSIGKVAKVPMAHAEAYLRRITAHLDIDAVIARNYRVITDFCNGSGTMITPRFAAQLGIELIPINDTVSGFLPHTPEPRPRSSAQVQSIMRVLNADVGFVFNSDMSRFAVVTCNGETLSEEYSFPLVADHVLARRNNNKSVVTNWCTTRTLDEVVRRHNGCIYKTKVGQAAVIDKMMETRAALAGEGNGSVAFAGSVNGFDAFEAMGCILEAMALSRCTSAELATALPRYHIVKRKISCRSSHAYTLLRNIKNYYKDAQITEEDGFRFDWEDGWLHLRASVTEPVIRMIVEWRSREQAEDKAIKTRGLLERLVSA